MKIAVFLVEVTEYNLARIEKVYEKVEDVEFLYIYGAASVSGHGTNKLIPENAVVLEGSTWEKITRLRKILNTTQFDIIIINGYVGTVNMWLIDQARRRKIPYAIETDTPLHLPANPVKRLMKKCYLKCIFDEKAYGFPGGTRQTEVFKHYGMDPSHIHIMPMTVDTQEFVKISAAHSKEYYKEKHGVHGKKVILYVGRYAQEKNLSSLISAVAALSRHHNDIALCLVGKGPEHDALEAQINTEGIGQITRVEPYKLMPELAEYYSMADVFVLPSSFEPWGLVVNEALACSVPVIAAEQVGCVDDLIQKGINGDVYNTGDVRELERLLEKWLYNRPDHVDFSITDRWNHKKYLENFESALRGIKP